MDKSIRVIARAPLGARGNPVLNFPLAIPFRFSGLDRHARKRARDDDGEVVSSTFNLVLPHLAPQRLKS